MEPDLAIGREWMYVSRQFLKPESGANGDTARHFIHYRIEGDTSMGGETYRLLVEEGLGIFNSDLGLQKFHSLYAVKAGPSGVSVNRLKGGREIGRFPFKSGAGEGFDTSRFDDEIRALEFPFQVGGTWSYREAGHPYGYGAAWKTFLGVEEIVLAGKRVSAYKFELAIENRDYFKTFEWYVGGLKVFSLVSRAANDFSRDSLHFEQEFIGNGHFTRKDTQTVIDWFERNQPK
ncbi:MAG: hypothetical protein M3Y08_09640 [Fibrobacterota bacterium]|nr:hypothetical protein [Fibrobacterota bacterium]